jgi:Ca-activated chloride channel family protein
MKLQDDPRLTAYALGEVVGEEKARIEAELANSPGTTDEIEDIRRVGEILTCELGGSQGTNKKTDQAVSKKPDVIRLAIRIRRWGIFAAAACVVLSVGLSVFVPSFYRTKGWSHASRVKSIEESMSIHGQADASAETEQPALQLVPNSVISKTTPASNPTAQPGVDLWAVARVNNPTPKQFIAPSSTDQLAVRIPQSRGRNIDLGGVGKNRQDSSSGLPAVESLVTTEEAAIPFKHSNREVEGILWLDARENPTGRLPAEKEETAGDAWAYMDIKKDSSLSADKLSYSYMYHHSLNAEQNSAESNAEAYDTIQDNPFLIVDQKNALSTFSIDVDTASYSNIRRMLQSGQRPPKGAVRIEEMINYFPYDYPPPTDGRPFSVNVEIAQCPWQPEHRLARVGLRGKTFAEQERPACNLVFLIDVSGSMQPTNKLPLLKQAMGMLVNKLTERDRVAMVVYAGTSGMVLDSTRGDDHATIVAALERLEAGGSTNGAGGIELAYKIAAEHKIDGGANRVILATDGDFNVGIINQSDLVNLIEQKARGGVFLSVLGVGMGNYKDSTLEKLADKGNGNYAYIDTLAEARKVLVDQVGGTLVTIAKDVKIQIEFNPAIVKAYRLIGYENRILAAEDFNNDKKDAGEIGAGHTVTALYELVPIGGHIDTPSVDPLKYQPQSQAVDATTPSIASRSGETMTVKLRYKQPDGDTSSLIEQPVVDGSLAFSSASADTRFAAAVAAFGMLLRDSPHKGSATYSLVSDLAGGATINDVGGYRAEFQTLVQKANQLPISEPRP